MFSSIKTMLNHAYLKHAAHNTNANKIEPTDGTQATHDAGLIQNWGASMLADKTIAQGPTRVRNDLFSCDHDCVKQVSRHTTTSKPHTKHRLTKLI